MNPRSTLLLVLAAIGFWSSLCHGAGSCTGEFSGGTPTGRMICNDGLGHAYYTDMTGAPFGPPPSATAPSEPRSGTDTSSSRITRPDDPQRKGWQSAKMLVGFIDASDWTAELGLVYLEASLDAIAARGTLCVPEKISLREIADTVKAYVRAHPEVIHDKAVTVVESAIRQACEQPASMNTMRDLIWVKLHENREYAAFVSASVNMLTDTSIVCLPGSDEKNIEELNAVLFAAAKTHPDRMDKSPAEFIRLAFTEAWPCHHS
jgi:hypothetical protein